MDQNLKDMGSVVSSAASWGAIGTALGATVATFSTDEATAASQKMFMKTTAGTGAFGCVLGAGLGIMDNHKKAAPKPVHHGFHADL